MDRVRELVGFHLLLIEHRDSVLESHNKSTRESHDHSTGACIVKYDGGELNSGTPSFNTDDPETKGSKLAAVSDNGRIHGMSDPGRVQEMVDSSEPKYISGNIGILGVSDNKKLQNVSNNREIPDVGDNRGLQRVSKKSILRRSVSDCKYRKVSSCDDHWRDSCSCNESSDSTHSDSTDYFAESGILFLSTKNIFLNGEIFTRKNLLEEKFAKLRQSRSARSRAVCSIEVNQDDVIFDQIHQHKCQLLSSDKGHSLHRSRMSPPPINAPLPRIYPPPSLENLVYPR